MYPLL